MKPIYVASVSGAIRRRKSLCCLVISKTGPATANGGVQVSPKTWFNGGHRNIVLTTTESTSKEGHSTQLSWLSIGISIRSDDLIKYGSQSNTQANINAMDSEQDPKVAIFRQHFKTFDKRRSISGLSIAWWRLWLGWHEDQWNKCHTWDNSHDNELNVLLGNWYEEPLQIHSLYYTLTVRGILSMPVAMAGIMNIPRIAP